MANRFIIRETESGESHCLVQVDDDNLIGVSTSKEEKVETRPLKLLRYPNNSKVQICVALWGDEIITGLVRSHSTKEFSITPAPGSNDLSAFSSWREIRVMVRTEAVDEMAQLTGEQSHLGGKFVISSPIPGLVKAIAISVGDEIEAGQNLLILEAMKMENEIDSPHAGTVKQIHVTEGESVAAGKAMIELEI